MLGDEARTLSDWTEGPAEPPGSGNGAAPSIHPAHARYFSRRNPPERIDFEEAYWGTVVDPDGAVRCLTQERERHLRDVTDEVAFLNGLEPGRVLDVGCGLGFVLSGLNDSWEKHGVEVSVYAARHAAKWGKIHIGDLASANYPDSFFDAVILYHVIEHVADPIALIREVRRVLRKGGVLVLGTPDFDSGCARRFGHRYRLLHDETHISLFTTESMHRFLHDHGFSIERVEYPFFDTPHFTPENLMRLFDTDQVSPPFYGNIMTFYCRRPDRGRAWESLTELSRLAAQVADTLDSATEAAGKRLADCLLSGRKVLACGNGGSAADAQHFVAELVGRMSKERRALPAISLSSDPSVVTALGNDYGYENLFARQVEALAGPGDILVAISTSGRSRNIINAIRRARALGVSVIALVGADGDEALDECEHCLHIPATDTQRVQELHMALLHTLCDYVEARLEPCRGPSCR
jgi:D-sedoheptulose 7-phosphate isomerase